MAERSLPAVRASLRQVKLRPFGGLSAEGGFESPHLHRAGGFSFVWIQRPFLMVTLYVIQGRESGKRYIGITNDLRRRLSEHRSGRTKGGQILGAFMLLHTESFPTHTEARRREKYLKSGSGREWLNAAYPRSGPASGR